MRQLRTFAALAAVLMACSSSSGQDAAVDAGIADTAATPPDAPGDSFPEGKNPCPSVDNPAGRVVDLPWPNPSNVHFATEGDTVRFHWDDGTPHNVLQVAFFEGQDPPTGKFSDAKWPNQLRSGAKSAKGSFDWNTGVSPCGYRPGIYFFVDEDTPAAGIVSVALTTKDNPSPQYAKRKCSALSDPKLYFGRYASFASRADCTQFEVNNFTTEAHFDWVEPTFAAVQGDLVLFRWSGLHNVVQVHDVDRDTLVPGGLLSGPRTNCVPGPNYTCVNGAYSLGEFLIDTTNHRPGMIHISDGCAYGCASCPWECRGADKVETGTNMQFLLRRAENHTSPSTGACCAIDKSKGTACRVIDLYNDNDGMQFDYNVPVNRGDLVRIRWGGTIKIVQTLPNSDGSPSKTPKPGGLAMSAPVECIPGPNWSCLGGNTEQAQFILDVDRAIAMGAVETRPGGKQFDFHAFGENKDGGSSSDSGILLYVDRDEPYASNPPCP